MVSDPFFLVNSYEGIVMDTSEVVSETGIVRRPS